MIEKLALALINSTKRLRPFFQSYQIKVNTDHPLKQVMRKPKFTGRMVPWSVKLFEFSLKCEPKCPIKGQCLVDFIVKFASTESDIEGCWTLYVDGASNNKGSDTEVTLEGLDDISIEQSLRFDWKVSNNQAEYKALITSLKLAIEVDVKKLKCISDSKLVIEQVNKVFQARQAQTQKNYHLVKRLLEHFENYELIHVDREKNDQANALY